MEYIISNKSFKGAKTVDNEIYYSKEFEFKRDIIGILDGFFFSDELFSFWDIYLNIEQEYIQGTYSAVFYNIKKKQLIFKNDQLGKIPTFMYQKGNYFIISNNVWNIVRNIEENIEIDVESVKAQSFFFADPSENRTIFKDVSRISNATIISYNVGTKIIKQKKYYSFTYEPDYSLKISDEAEILDSNFINLFNSIKKQNPDKIMGFGNSGGFDSRLIAQYAKETNMNAIGYVIGNKRPNYILDSTTHLLSKKVSDFFEFENKFVTYNDDDFFNHLVLDIRNNPFSGCQLMINPYEEMSFFDYEITGQTGYFTRGVPEAISDNNISKDNLSNFLFEKLSYYKSCQKGFYDKLKKIKAHLNLKYNIDFKKSYLNDIYSELELPFFKEMTDEFLRINDGNSNHEIYENFYELVIGKYDLSGGYESLNRTKKSYFLYYPYFYDRMKFWPPYFFKDRKMLKEIFKLKDSFLTDLPGQDFQPAKDQLKLLSLAKKIEMAIRGRGLNFDYILSRSKYKMFVNSLIKRDNPLFYSIFDKKQLSQTKIFKTTTGMNILKIKLLLDIVYYKEYHYFDKPEFNIAD